MENERRLGARWPLDCQARITLKYKNNIKNYDAHIQNISLKGMQVLLKKKLPGPEVLKMKISLPENTSVEARVKVISLKIVEGGGGFVYNLAMIGIKENGRELISRLVNKKLFPEIVKNWWAT